MATQKDAGGLEDARLRLTHSVLKLQKCVLVDLEDRPVLYCEVSAVIESLGLVREFLEAFGMDAGTECPV